jgi:hypothetical protein
MYLEENLWNFSVLQRVHLSNLVFCGEWLRGWAVDGSALTLCPVAGFGNRGVESSGSASNYYYYHHHHHHGRP